MMRIAIAGIALETSDAGFRVYFEQLVQGLARRDRDNHYTLFINAEISDRIGVVPENFEVISIRVPRINALKLRVSLIWEQILLPRICVLRTFDVLHSAVSMPPLLSPTKTVVTVYDLMYRILPKTQTTAYRAYWNLLLPLTLQRTEQIIAISKNTQKDLLTHYRISPDKIRVVYPYVRSQFSPQSEFKCREVAARYGLPEKYVLYVGTLEGRKNLPNLIMGFALARKMGLENYHLVLVGKKGRNWEEIPKIIEKLGVKQNVILVGYIAEEDLPAIYTGATLFAYVSLYEGFGLPVVEAMACGTPVMVSNVSSLPEVVGDSGALVAPQDVDSMAEEMKRVLTDKEWHNDLASRAIRRCKEFSEDRFVDDVLCTYDDVASATGTGYRK